MQRKSVELEKESKAFCTIRGKMMRQIEPTKQDTPKKACTVFTWHRFLKQMNRFIIEVPGYF